MSAKPPFNFNVLKPVDFRLPLFPIPLNADLLHLFGQG